MAIAKLLTPKKIGIFLNVSKAFDTIDHKKKKIFINKSITDFVVSIVPEWFENYLTYRTQYVAFNNCTLNPENSICSVSQSSILGPLLFI